MNLVTPVAFVLCWHFSLCQDYGSTNLGESTESHEDGCECVPSFQCGMTSSYAIDPRQGTSGCSNPLEVCCPPGSIIDQQPTSLSQCGIQNVQVVDYHIVGGSQAGYGEFPWMVAVLAPGRRFVCGGSLIHPRLVLTAAHCVTKLNPSEAITIRVGEWSSQAAIEPLPVQNRAVTEIIIHEQFDPYTLYNDIALLILDSPVRLGGNVEIICLPQPNEVMDGRNCFASGWGKDALGPEGKHPDILKSVELCIIPREKCQRMFRHTKLGLSFHLHLSFLCAGGHKGQDTCRGDGGGPLVCPSKENPAVFVQAGIVSWGVGCGSQIPAAYTNVALFRSWLELQILRKGISS